MVSLVVYWRYLKLGLKTSGDKSDISKPRIVPTQNGVYHSSNDYYYYRQ